MENIDDTKTHANFRSIIVDFTSDLTTTFPDYSHLWSSLIGDLTDINTEALFEYCLSVFPERFFDILYQNEEMFSIESEINTFFLPNVDFKVLYNRTDISEKTKKYIWKYLQLILFTIVGEVKDKNNFGDTLNMFEGIDEVDLQEKMKETMESITEFFKNIIQDEQINDLNVDDIGNGVGVNDCRGRDEGHVDEGDGADDPSVPSSFKEGFKNMFENMPNQEDFKKSFPLPNMDNIQDHLKTLFEGKIGSLAREMAEEISGDFGDILGEDVKDIRSTKDVIQKLMKNPKKIMELMKTVGTKLDNKMKNGEISREEIMKEAGDLFGKMKDMGGQEQFNDMFRNLTKGMSGLGGLGGLAGMAANMGGMGGGGGMGGLGGMGGGGGGLGKNQKIDQNAINRMAKMQEMKDRMRKKLELKKQMEEFTKAAQMASTSGAASMSGSTSAYSLNNTTDPNNFVFKLDDEEAQEKSFIHPDIIKEMELEDAKKKNAASGVGGVGGGESGASKKKKKNKKTK